MSGTALGIHKPFLGVLHLQPLPGAPGYRGSMTPIIDRALRDARTYLEGGLDGLVVENFGDAPFFTGEVPPETVAALTAVACEIRALGSFPLGVNVLRSDGPAALAVAIASGAQFIRVNVLTGTMVTDQGTIEGCAARLLRRRAACRTRIEVWGDLLVKHARPLVAVDEVELARDMGERGGADALIVTGTRTGIPVDLEQLERLRRARLKIPIVIGSGVRPENLESVWSRADAFIVGSSLKKGGRATGVVEATRVKQLQELRRRLARRRA